MRWNQGISDDGVGSGDPELEQTMPFPVVIIYLFGVFLKAQARVFILFSNISALLQPFLLYNSHGGSLQA